MLFGTRRQQELYIQLDDEGEYEVRYGLEHTPEITIEYGYEEKVEMCFLSDDKTVVSSRDIDEIPEEIIEKFEKFGYKFVEFQNLTKKQKEELGVE